MPSISSANTDEVTSINTSSSVETHQSRKCRNLKWIFQPETGDSYIVVLIIALFTIIFTYLSYLRYVDFYTTNWDLGISMQLLWTTTHGYLMYESGDFEFYGVKSFLQVHSTYIAYPISFLYRVYPTAQFLFTLQALFLALSAIPLFLIAKNAGLRRAWTYAGILIFLLNFPLIGGLLYDFHWEAFLPLEFFSMFYLMMKRRYLYSLIPFSIGCATLEVFPFLTSGLLIYLFVERSKSGWKKGGWHDRRESVLLISYFLLTIIVYVIIRALQYDVIPLLVGAKQNGGGVGPSVTGLFGFVINIAAIEHSLLYWLLIYAAFGFVAILYPRHLIIALPWILYTFLLAPSFADYFGNQNAMIPIMPVTIGLLYGLKELQRIPSGLPNLLIGLTCLLSALVLFTFSLFSSFTKAILAMNNQHFILILDILLLIPVIFLLFLHFAERERAGKELNDGSVMGHGQSGQLAGKKTPLFVFFAVIVAFNVMMSPLNTANFNATPMPGYQFNYSSNAESHFIRYAVDRISYNATILASDNLFPYVANYPRAFSVAWFKVNRTFMPFFPFNSSHLPQFVFLDASQFFLMPDSILSLLFNSSYYSLITYINYENYPGSIYLFKLHSTQSTTYYNASPPQKDYFFYGKMLSIGESGHVVKLPGSRFGYVIESRPALNLSGNGHAIWYGPYRTFEPGKYRVTISLEGGNYNNSTSNNPILYMNSNGYEGPTYYSATIYASQLSSISWKEFNFTINITKPFPLTEFRGYLDYNESGAFGYVYLNYIEVQLL